MCELVERYASQVAEEVAAEAEEKAKAEVEKAKKISAIKSARAVYDKTCDGDTAILCISSSLDISEEEAKEIFEKEVL